MFYKSLVVFSFISIVYSALGFFLATKEKSNPWWIISARWMFGLGTVLIFAVGSIMIHLISSHQFQYNYVYAYSSLELPTKYLVSTFWAGQEGSFLLWIFFIGILGLFLIKTAKDYEPYVMTTFSIAMAFLISMILGVKIGDLVIGSNPFKTIYEAFPGQVPLGFIPADGRGLNPLLQNYWMTIHPPVLFSGFAATLVPFTFAFAALWRKKYDDWITPAMPWTLWTAASLGTGIVMGGYWAYETLGWGGYWAWDPVENGSLVPWLITVAGLHSMIVQKKIGTLKRFSIFLGLLIFISVVYSTFLTRSGVLADFSVHSFTGLGLYGQLLIYILIFLFGGYGFLIYRWKSIPYPKEGSEIYSREFLMVVGALMLTLLGIAISAGTSLPIISQTFSGHPKTLDVAGFNTLVIPLVILIALLLGVGQMMWYSKTDVKVVAHNMLIPVAISVLSTVALIGFGVQDIRMILLGFAGFLALFSNIAVLMKIIKGNFKLAGGAISHIGIAVMLLGFIASGRYDTVGHFNLPKNEVVNVHGYDLKFIGDTKRDGKDAFLIQSPDNKIELKPIMYWSDFTQSWMRSPDIKVSFNQDLYIAPVMRQEATTENDLQNMKFEKGESKAIGKNTITFEKFNILSMAANKVSVAAVLKIKTESGEEEIQPIYGIDETKRVNSIPAKTQNGLEISIAGIDASTGKVTLAISGNTGISQAEGKEILVVEASIKPFIGLVWLGTLIMIFGFLTALYRRWLLRNQVYSE